MEKVIVHVSIDPELDVLKFEVDLGSLPNSAYNGHEFEEETQTKYRVGQKVSVQVNAIIDQMN